MKYIYIIAVIIWISTFQQSNASDLSNNLENITMEITSPQKEYFLGDYINFFVILKNSGNTLIEWQGVTKEKIGTEYRLFLFKDTGEKFAYPQKETKKQYRQKNRSTIMINAHLDTIKPGEHRMRKILLNKWFDIKEEGTYYLVVMLRHPISWDKGFISSNIFKFKVVSPSTPDPLNKK